MAIKSINNTVVSYNSNALTGFLDSASIQAVVNAIDATVLNSSGTAKIPGLGDWTVQVGGKWSSVLHGYFSADLITPGTMRTLVVTIGESGDTITYTWTNNAFISDYQFTADPTGALVWTGSISVSGAPTMS